MDDNLEVSVRTVQTREAPGIRRKDDQRLACKHRCAVDDAVSVRDIGMTDQHAHVLIVPLRQHKTGQATIPTAVLVAVCAAKRNFRNGQPTKSGARPTQLGGCPGALRRAATTRQFGDAVSGLPSMRPACQYGAGRFWKSSQAQVLPFTLLFCPPDAIYTEVSAAEQFKIVIPCCIQIIYIICTFYM